MSIRAFLWKSRDEERRGWMGPEMCTKATVCGRIVFLSPPWLLLQRDQPLHVPAGTAMSAASAVMPSPRRPGYCGRG